MDRAMQGATEIAAAAGGSARVRPSSKQLFAAALELIASGANVFKATARRYSICAADAEDAYQRGLEILITKAPTAERAELKPWLHTVIKHEALALRRQRERLLEHDLDLPMSASGSNAPGPDEGVGERERARHTGEALRQLKQSELHCLLLKALGYSYDEIALRTGYSWTKVNRSLTEGRRRFFDGFAQIQSGERCESFRPLLSAVSDGEVRADAEADRKAGQDDELALKQHLEHCHACRAVLRGYRSVPGHLAQLLPPAAILPALERGGWWPRLHDAIVGGVGDRIGVLGWKLHQASELVAGQKAAAVVASTAAIAGGTAVHERALERHSSHRGPAVVSEQTDSSTERAQAIVQPAPAAPPDQGATRSPETEPGSSERPAEEEPATTGGEFDLAGAAAAPASSEAASRSEAAVPARGALEPVASPPSPGRVPPSTRPASRATGGGGGEFGP